jgi:superfamily II DNA helicase RecQ
MSELAKQQCWELFSNGKFRIICATDAAGMGCNVSDVKYIVMFGMTKSLGTISQRWGRAGRDRTTDGVCLWLVPKWAFRPQQRTNPTIQQLQTSRNNRPLETKHNTLQRAKLEPTLEEFINIGSQSPPGMFALKCNTCFYLTVSSYRMFSCLPPRFIPPPNWSRHLLNSR